MPETRTSLTKVRNDLYDYVDGGPSDFRVTPDAPLSFAFPSAYYTYDVNHAGGAVSLIGLELDLATFGPFSRAPVVRMPDAQTPRAKARESRIRSVSVTIYSNYFEDGDDLVKREVFRKFPRLPKDAREVPIMRGYKVALHRNVQDKHLPKQPPIVVANFDIANSDLYAIPANAEDSLVQRVICDMGVPNCVASFVFEGRLVEVVFDKNLFHEIDILSRRINQLLRFYRV